MKEGILSLPIRSELSRMISARMQLLTSIKDPAYRHAFVQERVRTSVALQIRSLRDQRNNMTQQQLGEKIGMAQTWISRLENPDYGKMTVATLLRLAEAFDTDLEIKFRPFSWTIREVPRLTSKYFEVPSFDEEFGEKSLNQTDSEYNSALTSASMNQYQTQKVEGLLVSATINAFLPGSTRTCETVIGASPGISPTMIKANTNVASEIPVLSAHPKYSQRQITG